MANKITNTQHYSDIADAIRAKNGGSDTYTPAQMAQAIEDLPAAENTELMALLAGTAARGALTVRNVERLDMTSIGLGFSNGTNKVTELHMPDTLSLCSVYAAFAVYTGFFDTNDGNANLQVLDIPKCTRLCMYNNYRSTGYDSFKNLTTINAPELTALHGCLRSCGIQHINFPKLEDIDNNMFWLCTSLKDVILPALRTLPGYIFYGCTALETAILESCVPSSSFCFQGCSSLTLCDLGGTESGRSIGYNTFYNCTALVALVLRSTTMIGLAAVGNLGNTPIEAGTGYIYVPRSLISSYEAATNWSTFAGQFRAIEDYTNDGTLTGDFVMPT